MNPYGHTWRKVTRPAILARAGGVFAQDGSKYLGGAQCERCGVSDLMPLSVWQRSTIDVAHLVILPGQPGHDSEDNLAALCRTDHRALDYPQWAAKFRAWLEQQRIERAERLDRERPILQAILSINQEAQR